MRHGLTPRGLIQSRVIVYRLWSPLKRKQVPLTVRHAKDQADDNHIPYKMNAIKQKPTKCEGKLGVWVSSDLTWTKQVLDLTACANKLLGYIRHNKHCIWSIAVRKIVYISLVRSHLLYAGQIWSPPIIELISNLERMWRYATKYILHLPFQCNVSYSSKWKLLNLLPICCWQEFFFFFLSLK